MNSLASWLLEWRARGLVRRLHTHLPSRGCILDIGSGTGHNARAITSHTNLKVVETDVVNMRIAGPGPVLFDGEDLPFNDDVFDGAVVLFVLHYVERPEKLLREARRVTRGPVIVVQSTHRGRLGLLLLRIRELVQGRLAFRLARVFRIVGNVPNPLRARQYFVPETMSALFTVAGLCPHLCQKSAHLLPLSRDLYLFT